MPSAQCVFRHDVLIHTFALLDWECTHANFDRFQDGDPCIAASSII